ncbi:MAG: hypothetical protein MJZ62_05260 [Bacteroidales bacterium]|nr:hypothetical protein [Bacteroidales bacterium]
MDIKKLFKQKDQPQVGSEHPLTTNNGTMDVQFLNPDARRDKETYNQWGSRMCGKVAASNVALPAYLQSVYYDVKKVQSQNDTLQLKLKQDIQNEADKNRSDQNDTFDKIKNCEDKVNLHQQELDDLKKAKHKIEEGKEEVNKEEKMKMIIGIGIIIPLTIYLIVFYSSAFYSAFFKDFQSVDGLASAMFDANAIPSAFKDGFMEAVFILFAPIIFLGLGFVLHFFSKESSKMKYPKMTAILLITLTFDVIIAYQIGKHIYDNWVLGQLAEFPEFSIKMAITDPNFWAVIFCGFIAYIIWGLVFNLVISAYNNLDLTKSKLKHIDSEMAEIKMKIDKSLNDKNQLQSEITKLKGEEQKLLSQLGNFVIYSIADIKTEMNNFYTGWLQNMVAQGCSIQSQQEAKRIYENTINEFFNVQQ